MQSRHFAASATAKPAKPLPPDGAKPASRQSPLIIEAAAEFRTTVSRRLCYHGNRGTCSKLNPDGGSNMRSLRASIAYVAIIAAFAATSIPISDSARAARGCGSTVCGYKSDGPQTFDNACLARRAGARVEHQGPCQMVLCVSPLAELGTQPMCGIDPSTNKRMTFPNNCAAELSHATWVSNGPCRGRR
jgi:hypothetical protein